MKIIEPQNTSVLIMLSFYFILLFSALTQLPSLLKTQWMAFKNEPQNKVWKKNLV